LSLAAAAFFFPGADKVLKEAREKSVKLESLVYTGQSRGIFAHKTRDENIFEWS